LEESLKNPKYKVIVFDFDGTLVPSNDIKRDCFFSVAREYTKDDGIIEGILDNCKGDRTVIFTKFSKDLKLNQSSINDLLLSYSNKTRKAISQLEFYPGAINFIESCKSLGILTILSSATPHKEINLIASDLSIHTLFEKILGGPESKESRLKKIQFDYKCKFQEILVIGDGEDDYLSAKNTCAHFIPVNNAVYFSENQRKLDFNEIIVI